MIGGKRKTYSAPEVGSNDSRPSPQRSDLTGNIASGNSNRSDTRLTIYIFGEQNSVRRLPGEPAWRGFGFGRDVACLATSSRNHENIPARRSLIAHQAGDKCDGLTLRGPAGYGNLQRRLVDGFHLSTRQGQGVELGNVPVVIASAVCGRRGETLAVRRPVVFVNV